MRLDKLLSHAGYGTRQEVKKMIQSGMITINGKVVKKAGTIVHLDRDIVQYQQEEVQYETFQYIMLNKPKGVLSATENSQQSTVIDLLTPSLKQTIELFPVGRLDKDTTGLLLITNDGDLAHQLLSPNKKVPKKYQATVTGEVTLDDIHHFTQGIQLKDFKTQPAQLEIVDYNPQMNQTVIHITITEGKFHQVKRMFQAVGKTVIELQRLTMGSLILDSQLKLGEWRYLKHSELVQLQTS